MELRHLRYFVAVADDGNIGRAATRLRVAQSALSRQLQDLEREIGARLLDRLSRGVRLTEAGRVFAEHARRTLELADEAVRAARAAADGEAGTLRIAPPDFGTRAALAADALARLRALRPKLQVELHAVPWPEHVEHLLARRIDVGFGIAGSADEYPAGVHADRLDDEPLAWALLAAHHPLASRETLSLAALADVPMVLSDRAAIPGMHDRILAAVRAGGVEPRVVPAPPSFASVVQLVAVGAGWCAVVDSGALPPPPGTVAVRVPELAAACVLQLHVLRRADDAVGPAATFVDCLLAARDA